MTTQLTKATNQLYDTFSKYTVIENLRERSCECCVSRVEVKQLLSKPLKQLDKNDIYHFMTSALTTFGDVEDYKHFLPRILELMISCSDTIDDFLIFEKLEYCKWDIWNTNEVEAIQSFFSSLLAYGLDKGFRDLDYYTQLNLKYNDIKTVSNILINSNSKNLFKKIIDDVITDYYYPIDKRLMSIYSNKKILEKIQVLYFKTTNGNDADRISIAYTILENYFKKNN